MSKLFAKAATGLEFPVFVLVRRSDGFWWNGTDFEAFDSASVEDYAIEGAEYGDTGEYNADNPSPDTQSEVRFVAAVTDTLTEDDLAENVLWTETIGSPSSDVTDDVFARDIDGVSFERLLMDIGALLTGENSGANTGIETYYSAGDSSVPRLVYTVDSTGNRSSVVRS